MAPNPPDRPKQDYFKAFFISVLPPAGLPRRFGIVTAYNVAGEICSAKINADADARLEKDLLKAGLQHFRVSGGSRDGSHHEQGFGIVVDSPDEIRVISRRYHQDAFFWVEDEKIFVSNTEGEAMHFVGKWNDRNNFAR